MYKYEHVYPGASHINSTRLISLNEQLDTKEIAPDVNVDVSPLSNLKKKKHSGPGFSHEPVSSHLQ